MRLARVFILLTLAALLLGGCNWFRSLSLDKDKPGEPAELVDFEPTLNTEEVWSSDIGKGTKRDAQQLRPAAQDGRIFVADYKGLLAAVDAASGSTLWELDTDLPFSGGPGLTEDEHGVGMRRVLAGLVEDGAERLVVADDVVEDPVAGTLAGGRRERSGFAAGQLGAKGRRYRDRPFGPEHAGPHAHHPGELAAG